MGDACVCFANGIPLPIGNTAIQNSSDKSNNCICYHIHVHMACSPYWALRHKWPIGADSRSEGTDADSSWSSNRHATKSVQLYRFFSAWNAMAYSVQKLGMNWVLIREVMLVRHFLESTSQILGTIYLNMLVSVYRRKWSPIYCGPMTLCFCLTARRAYKSNLKVYCNFVQKALWLLMKRKPQ